MTTTKPTAVRHPRCHGHRAQSTALFRPRSHSPDRPEGLSNTYSPAPLPAGVEWLTPDQAAKHMQIPARQLQQWRYLRKGPPYSLAGRAIRYRRTDLDEWLVANRVEPTNT